MKHIKPHLSFSKSFMYSVHQMYFLVQKNLEKKLLKQKTLSFSQFLVLVSFVDCKDSPDLSQAGVAKIMHLTEATVSRHIDKLKVMKILIKTQDAKNKTKHIIELTKKGRQEFEKARKIIEKELEEIFNVIKVGDRKSIINNFTKVIEKLYESF